MKKIVIVYLVGLFLPVVLLDRSAFADVGADLSQAEGLYKAGQYAQAEQAYLKVTREADPNKPAESEAVFAAAKGLSLVYIATDRLGQAKEAIQPLLARPTPHAVHEIVEGAKALNKLSQVHQLYREMVAARPKDPQVLWLKMGLAIANAHLADDKAVEAILQDIAANHESDDRVAEAVGQVAWAYRKLQQYDKALRMDQYNVGRWPRKARAAYVQQGIVVDHIGLKDFAAADQALEVLIQKFGQDADASKLILWSGFSYQDAKESERASKVYELVVQHYPQTPEAVTAQVRLAEAGVEAEDRSRMEQTIPLLLTQFAPTQDKAEGLRTLSRILVWKHFEYATRPARQPDLPALTDEYLLAIANYMLATWPNSDWAMWAQRSLATVAIHRGDDAAAQAAIDRLTGDYADRKDTPAVLNFLADYSFQLRKYGQAEQLYKHVCDHWPRNEQALLAKAGRARVCIVQGDDKTAEAIFQEIMADYANHPKLAETLLALGGAYHDYASGLRSQDATPPPSDLPPALREPPLRVRESYAKAIEKWAILLERYPDMPEVSPMALYHSAMAYSQMGDPVKAIECYQQLLERWPEQEYNHHALLRLPGLYEQLVFKQLLPQEQANALIRAAYEQFVRKYPGSPAVEAARQQVDYYQMIMEGSSHEG
ncbi:MAG: hypothetical protein A2Y77_08705 [Planctomycetes bacterium RBG_13_62_9]|nr:MAG: hypothetical protein A2Y77_08705 [Planctomycetes bacterium RBG_13_62_9]